MVDVDIDNQSSSPAQWLGDGFKDDAPKVCPPIKAGVPPNRLYLDKPKGPELVPTPATWTLNDHKIKVAGEKKSPQ